MATRTKTIYYEGIGRRKEASARVRIFLVKEKKDEHIVINEKDFLEYFPVEKLQRTVEEPMKKLKIQEFLSVTGRVSGGGITGQAEAIRMGLSRALEKYHPEFRPELKKLGFLTRDDRMKERKKPGLKGARKGQQWSKR